MEAEQVQKNMANLKQNLSKKNIIVSIIIVFFEIIFLFFMTKSTINLELRDVEGFAFFGIAYILILGSIPAFFGILLAIKFLKRNNIHIASIALLFFSICTFPPFSGYIAGSISKKIVPPMLLARMSPQEKLELQQQKELHDSRYIALKQIFQTPQKVSYVDNQDSVLILENGNVIAPAVLSSQKNNEGFLSIKEVDLIGEEVKIELLPQSSTAIVMCEDASSSYYSTNRPPQVIRKRYNIPIDKSGICNVLIAKVFYKGQLLVRY